jgi:SOS-response transcriptional repressor LexA
MIKERVVPLLAQRRITQAQFAEELGMSAKHLSEILNGKSGQNIENLTKIAQALRTSISFLLGETDDPDPLSLPGIDPEEDAALLRLIMEDPRKYATAAVMVNASKPAIQEAYKLLVGDLNKSTLPPLDPNTGPVMKSIPLPLIDQEACAGKGFDYADAVAEAISWIHWPVDEMGGPIEPYEPFFVRVRGDSMEGIGIEDGCMVLINPNVDILNGNPAYVEWCGVRSVKGFVQYPDGRVELRPANPNYQTVYISAEDANSENFRIIGKVVRWVNQGVPRNVM